MRIKKELDIFVFTLIGYILLILLSVYCLLPFLMMISASFTSESSIYTDGYRLIPKQFSLDAYRTLFLSYKDIVRAYGVTLFVTVSGTMLSLFIISMTAYVLYRPDFKYRNKFAFFFYFPTLFSGGMVSQYILIVKYLNMKNSLLVLIIPALLNGWYIVLMRNFMKSIPFSITESAKLDGANDFKIFLKIILALALPGLATIGLFMGLFYWNDWFYSMLYIENRNLFTLQYVLYRMLSSIKFAEVIAASSGVPMADIPNESIKMAMAVLATGPIIFLYPFIQKYFVKGLTVGAVKG